MRTRKEIIKRVVITGKDTIKDKTAAVNYCTKNGYEVVSSMKHLPGRYKIIAEKKITQDDLIGYGLEYIKNKLKQTVDILRNQEEKEINPVLQ